MLIKLITATICYSELNEIKIKVLIKIYEIFQAKKKEWCCNRKIY